MMSKTVALHSLECREQITATCPRVNKKWVSMAWVLLQPHFTQSQGEEQVH